MTPTVVLYGEVLPDWVCLVVSDSDGAVIEVGVLVMREVVPGRNVNFESMVWGR